jgi:hypothetical protein
MQISTNSLLIAAQQARAAQPGKTPVKEPAFEPLGLRQASAKPAAATPAAGGPLPRPGSQLDIRV